MVAPFDLQVRPGEIVGLAGLLGSGRTETAQLLFGIKPADSGEARLAGKRIHLSNPRRPSWFRLLPGRPEKRGHYRFRHGA